MSNLKISNQLSPGSIYSRKDLKNLFGVTDATINNGIFRPKGFDSVWLFVTEQKTSDRTQYHDELLGDELHMQGQLQGRTDHLITDHKEMGVELLVFHRKNKKEYPSGGFRYEGTFDYRSHSGEKPTSFVLRRVSVDTAEQALEAISVDLSSQGEFNATNLPDARRRIQCTIVQRRGQPKFRKQLLKAYQNRCAVTGCAVTSLLEAAHIRPYQGDHTNVVPNGLLLRADIHTLFDLYLLWIDPDTLTIRLSSELEGSEYAALEGKALRLPLKLEDRPNAEALKERRDIVKDARACQKFCV